MTRIALATFAVILASGLFSGGAKADPYPWCAIFSGDLGGVRSCYYFTIEQCRATVSGVGGFCQPNPWYTGAAPVSSRRTGSR